jgi:pimeloyl-ACP methyl ester carboxylesterase
MAKIADVTGRYVYLTVNSIEYRVYFEEAGQGIPLICQHTAGSDARQFRHLLEDPEITSNFRVIAYDLPYHGKSVPPAGVSWWEEAYKLTAGFFRNFVVALAHALDLTDPVFMGCSMGGHLAVDLACSYSAGLSAGGSQAPVVKRWRRASSLSSPHLAAVSR